MGLRQIIFCLFFKKIFILIVIRLKKRPFRKIPDGTKNVKALFNMAGYGAQRGGRGEKLSLKNVCARGKNKTRARKTTGAVSFGGRGRAAANEIRSVRLAFPWEFFSAAVLSVQSTRARRRRREPSSPATPSPHLPHLPPVRATLPLSLLCKSRKEGNKKCERDVCGSRSDKNVAVISSLVNRGSECCGFFFFPPPFIGED